MTVNISLFWVILFVVIIHTVLQHLINWMWRGINNSNDYYNIIVLGLAVTVLEALIITSVLYSILN